VREAGEEIVSEKEQQELVQALHRHLADGRLDIEGFDARVAAVYRANTRAEARAALDGLPLLDAAPSGRRSRRRHGEGTPVAPHWVATD
jgi:hypothetical protein